MDNTKEKKAKLHIFISALTLTFILFAELFLIITNPFMYTLLFVIVLAAVALGMVYLLVNAIMTITSEREEKRLAHFDNLYKSEKASYIMLKNKFEEIEEKLAIIQETSRIPSEEIINAQKGIAKVIINRSKENADAIINSNDQVLERLDEIDETQNTKFTGISKDQRLKLTEMSNQTELKLQDMVLQMKDMELRLNQAIMQGGGKQVVMTAPQMETMEYSVQEELDALDALAGLDDMMEEPVMMEEPIVVEEPVAEEVIPEEEPIMVEEPIVEAPGIDLSDPNKAMSPDDIAALFASMGGGNDEVSAEPVAEEVIPEEEPIMVEEPVVETPVVEAPGIDLSDPNKAMSPDDIAALFASMAGTDTAAEPVEEDPIVEEEIPPMPDLSDPNKVMSPDEIAALIANL